MKNRLFELKNRKIFTHPPRRLWRPRLWRLDLAPMALDYD